MEQFFLFYSMEFGLHNSWDFKQNYDEFVKEKEKEYRNSTACTVHNDITISEWDIYQFSKGIIENDSTQAFYDHLKEISIKNGGESNNKDSLMVAMHSGGSDYLFPSKVMAADFKRV